MLLQYFLVLGYINLLSYSYLESFVPSDDDIIFSMEGRYVQNCTRFFVKNSHTKSSNIQSTAFKSGQKIIHNLSWAKPKNILCVYGFRPTLIFQMSA